ncbi:hypothetical protein PAPYR_12100 [Paratrimastix pyriformis]|uniref:Secreted protein n=1 Tax=Paratrimastix pyriformis TaxID=342808 RepID=A0ABQ8U6E5_9EUKA|nr:hypothetical protein PAPYR_12100 [Paratrimastix pyriformis]
MLDLLLFLFGRLVFLAGALGLLLLSFIFGDSVQAKARPALHRRRMTWVQRAHVSSNGLAVPPPRSHPASDEESGNGGRCASAGSSAFLGIWRDQVWLLPRLEPLNHQMFVGVLKSIPAVWIFKKSNFFEVVF